jgi:hypothetical protein
MLTSDWKKSSYSGNTDNSCVEARRVDEGVEVRHSLMPDAGAIIYTNAEWDAFLKGAKDGEFDLNHP